MDKILSPIIGELIKKLTERKIAEGLRTLLNQGNEKLNQLTRSPLTAIPPTTTLPTLPPTVLVPPPVTVGTTVTQITHTTPVNTTPLTLQVAELIDNNNASSKAAETNNAIDNALPPTATPTTDQA